MYIIIPKLFFMYNEEKLYLAVLHSIGITQKKLHLIFSEKQNYREIYDTLNFNLLTGFGFNSNQIGLIIENKTKIDFNNIKNKLNQKNVKIITKFDIDYPNLLKYIPNPPFLFYLRGKIDNSPKIAVVGSRKISDYGEKVIKKIIPDLSKYFTIISGGAAGCDTLGHQECLNAGNKTISIIGTGIDIDYPVKNNKLYNKIVESGGGVISIFPVGEVGNSYNFPVRNELVAGLSNGVLVIEAGEKSGTLITANLALELGKDLFVVPGDIFKINSIGCNTLIKNGCAKLISSAFDILEEYNICIKDNIINNISKTFNEEIEQEIYDYLLLENLTIDELSKKNGLELSVLLTKLGFLEINNYIKKGIGGKYYVN